MNSFIRKARWACTLSLYVYAGAWVSAQTIQVGNATIPANRNTVSPAVALVAGKSAGSGVDFFLSERQQLTGPVLGNLTRLNLTGVSKFAFPSGSRESAAKKSRSRCKTFPGDKDWPRDEEWDVLNILTGGSLIKTVPLAAPCYNGWPQRDAAECAYIQSKWTDPLFQVTDPASIDFPLYEGRTCMPTDDPDGNCTLGGYPVYVINATTVAHVQLGINFARNSNLRLVVKNNGHDFAAKSAGAGALSIWTHYLNEIFFADGHESPYGGPVFKIGPGAEVQEVYAAADEAGVSVVGGIGRTVGLGGGYAAGGGHSPLLGHFGMAADQILALEVVLPDGSFVSVDQDQRPDLFWALRGGGGSTYGVVTSVVIRAYPKMPMASVSYSFSNTGTNSTTDTFWDAVRAFWDTSIATSDAGHYLYYSIACAETAVAKPAATNCTFAMTVHWAPNSTRAELEAFNAPFFARLGRLGLAPRDVDYNQQPAFKASFDYIFPPGTETVGTATSHVSSRLIPRSNWSNATVLDATHAAFRYAVESGGAAMLAYTYRPAQSSQVDQDNAVNPAWRAAMMHAMLALPPWADGAGDDVVAANGKRTTELAQAWRDVSPGAGAYMSESDINEPDFAQSFFGSYYPRLYRLKQEVDPWALLYAAQAVGSEDWYVTDQKPFFPTQNGRLCPKT